MSQWAWESTSPFPCSALFSEIHRVLRAGGRLVFREPIDDFAPWRWLRRIVYRVSPALDHTTEHPLRRDETVTQLASAGLQLEAWRGFGFIGFCLFMNSDVLVANRLFRFVPGIRGIVRIASHIDEAIVRGGSRDSWGLLAVGVARK
jgi:SAM-dependent methyltransferase